MAYWLRWLSRRGFTQICVAHGIVSWWSEDNYEARELQLWYREMDNCYRLYASNTAGVILVYVKLLMFLLCTSKSALTKTKQIVPCESTDKGVSSRGSRVRTKFYGSIIDSGSDRVLTMYNLTIIYIKPFLFKKLAYLCVYAVTLMYLL